MNTSLLRQQKNMYLIFFYNFIPHFRKLIFMGYVILSSFCRPQRGCEIKTPANGYFRESVPRSITCHVKWLYVYKREVSVKKA